MIPKSLLSENGEVELQSSQRGFLRGRRKGDSLDIEFQESTQLRPERSQSPTSQRAMGWEWNLQTQEPNTVNLRITNPG